jgi:hypothetical protein
MLVKRFALPTEVSCTDETLLPSAQGLSSVLHSTVDSATAEVVPMNAMDIIAVATVRPIVLSAFTYSPFSAIPPRIVTSLASKRRALWTRFHGASIEAFA